MKFTDIKQYTLDGNYRTNHSLRDLKRTMDDYIANGLILNPDFQRGHVWTDEQRIKFVEHLLRGGKTPPIYLNQKGWMKDFKGDFVCVDGLQRITACLRFLDNEIPVFGTYYRDFEDELHFLINMEFVVNNLPTKEDVLTWYIELNTGGTVHTDEEISRVKQLLVSEQTK